MILDLFLTVWVEHKLDGLLTGCLNNSLNEFVTVLEAIRDGRAGTEQTDALWRDGCLVVGFGVINNNVTKFWLP